MSINLKELFLAHREELQAYLVHRLRDREAAADLTQDTFLRFAERTSGAAIEDHRPYLFRIAHNLAVDHRRRAMRLAVEDVAPETLNNIPRDEPNQEDSVAARQRMELLRGVIAGLPERTRAIFVLHQFEDLTYPEVARRLGISESSVQKHLAKALRQVVRRVPRR